jgi:WD40 repeat protein
VEHVSINFYGHWLIDSGHAALSPDESSVLLSNLSDGLDLCTVGQNHPQQSYKFSYSGKGNVPVQVAFIEHGQAVLSGSPDGNVHVWDVTSAESCQVLEHEGAMCCLPLYLPLLRFHWHADCITHAVAVGIVFTCMFCSFNLSRPLSVLITLSSRQLLLMCLIQVLSTSSCGGQDNVSIIPCFASTLSWCIVLEIHWMHYGHYVAFNLKVQSLLLHFYLPPCAYHISSTCSAWLFDTCVWHWMTSAHSMNCWKSCVGLPLCTSFFC